MKKSTLALLAAGLLLAGTGTWYFAFRVDTTALLLASLPPRPQGVNLPAILADRIDNAEQDLKRHHTVESLAELSRLYHSNGYFAEAERCYAGLMELEPRKALWPHLRASILAGYGQLDDAIPLHRLAVELDPSYLPARVRLGDVLLKANRDAEAAAAYEGVLKRDSEHPYALQGLARVEMMRGEWDSARLHLEAAAAKTNYSIGGDLLVNAYEKTGRQNLARSLAAKQKASGAFYDIPDPWIDAIFIDCYDPYRATIASGSAARNQDFATAVKLLEHVNKVAPKYALAYYHMGLLMIDQQRTPQAIAAMEKSAELDPSFSDTWLRLVRLHTQDGNEMAARLAIENGIRLCPHSPHLHLERAKRQQAAGKLREAEENFKKVLTLRPDESFGYLELAKFYFSANRVEEALDVLNKGLEIEPEEPMIMSIMTFYAITLGDQAMARTWMKRMLEQPRSPQATLDALRQGFKNKFGVAF